MKHLLTLLVLIMTSLVWSNCEPGQMRAWNEASGYSCVMRFQNNVSDCVTCEGCNDKNKSFEKWMSSFPKAIYENKALPWWAQQGNFYYPNLHAPGVWNNQSKVPGIDASFYPGSGEVHALKPNIYIESIHDEKKFTLSFTSTEELSFLATTPPLDDKNTWKGKIINKDRFEVEDINYDYLFYDIRLPKEKMQLEKGLCATREQTIKWMLKDLIEMKYPAIAVQDFEEHWNVKIPDFPFFCIYPQYNEQLDAILPVATSLEKTTFIRSLYILVPHKKEPDVDEPQVIPFPILDSQDMRSIPVIKHENMFKEWGVAFLGE